ncbi:MULTISPECIES: DUF397 domain-containing protein [unclassified Streptomyces]|uniref:DUF397 domain-containing protein n=1 Tax=unclassified Streptomyces TaxID=2593676 RepID=UPI000B839193|nr:DUF397 domain-containing protein [Streptomyces sp. MnatMP-M77]MYT81082.1 DUF397 domain-containing protein [Streptomyces sp. SID8364]
MRFSPSRQRAASALILTSTPWGSDWMRTAMPTAVQLRSDAVLVRDSKNTQGPRLAVAPAAWAGFVAYAAAH